MFGRGNSPVHYISNLKGSFSMSFWVKGAIFVGGMAASTLGVKLLTSKTAKKVYTQTTAAVLRGKDAVMSGVTKVREGCGDIVSDAKEINEEKAEQAAAEEAADIIEDSPVSVVGETEQTEEKSEEQPSDEV